MFTIQKSSKKELPKNNKSRPLAALEVGRDTPVTLRIGLQI